MYKLLLIFVLVTLTTGIRNPWMKTSFAWRYLDFEWKSEVHRRWYLQNGRYNSSNVFPIDVDMSADGRVFVTTVKTAGNPATLNTVSRKCGVGGHLLKPYPSWSWYEQTDRCRGIFNVYRVAIDRCNRLWVLDTGLLSGQRVCPAKLLSFNLANNQLISRLEIPRHVAENATTGQGQLVTPIVEIGDNCTDYTVYMGDVAGHGIVVHLNGQWVRLNSTAFAPEPQYVNATIAGETFTLDDGIMGMALTPQSPQHPYRRLFFRPFASRSLYSFDTENARAVSNTTRYVQRNTNYLRPFSSIFPYASTRVRASFNTGTDIYIAQGTDVLSSQAAAMAFSSEGALFYGLTRELAIGCWNYRNPMHTRYFHIPLVDDRIQFLSGVKVVRMFDQEHLLVMSNRYQKIALGTLNWNEINFRLMKVPVRYLIQNSVCDNPSV